MPAEAPDTQNAVASPLRAGLEPARRWLATRGLSGRLLLLAALMVGLLGLGYGVNHLDRSSERAYLFGGYRYTADEVVRVLCLLESKSIDARNDGGQIDVPRSRLNEAYALASKNGLAPLSIGALADSPSSPDFWSTSTQQEQDALRRRAKLIETQIRKLDPRLSPFVKVLRAAPKGLAPAGPLRITVTLDVEGNAPLEPDLIDRIKVVVQGLEPELVPEEGLYLSDSQGNAYQMPGSADIEKRSVRRLREEQIRWGLEHQLAGVRDVRVSVSLEPVKETNAPEVPPPPAASIISVNTPPDGEAERGPAAQPAPPAAPTTTGPTATIAHVIVRVPRASYLEQARRTSGKRVPSDADVRSLVSQTEESIKKASALVLGPNEQLDLVMQESFESSEGAKAITPTADARSQDSSRAVLWGAGLAGALVAIGLVVRWATAPRSQQERVIPAPHYPRRGTKSQVPADRAREFVRQHPDVAAGVLQHWVGLGGPES